MDRSRALVIIRGAAHVAIVLAVSDIQHLSRDLRAEESRFVVAHLFPLREVFGELDELDTCGSLTVTGMRVVTLVAEGGVGWVELWRLRSCGGDEQGVDAR